MSFEYSLAILGCGHFGFSLAEGLLKTNLVPSQLTLTRRSLEPLVSFSVNYPGIQLLTDNIEAVIQSDIIILAVRPNQMAALCQSLSSCDALFNKLFISVAAGLPSSFYLNHLGAPVSFIRAMPNLAGAVSHSVTTLYSHKHITPAYQSLATLLFESIGSVVWVDEERDIDLMTAVSGSGISFYYHMMDSMVSVLESYGFTGSMAREIAIGVCEGAALSAKSSSLTLSELTASVVSPNGTTEAGLRELKEGGFSSLIQKAVTSAFERAGEISFESDL